MALAQRGGWQTRGYSDDCKLLEIVLPADFRTVTLAKV